MIASVESWILGRSCAALPCLRESPGGPSFGGCLWGGLFSLFAGQGGVCLLWVLGDAGLGGLASLCLGVS